MSYSKVIKMAYNRPVLFVNLAGREYVGLMDRLIHRISG